jgi:hypothetical protein
MPIVATLVAFIAAILMSFMMTSLVLRGRMTLLAQTGASFLMALAVTALSMQVTESTPDDYRTHMHGLTVLAVAWTIVSAWFFGDAFDNRKSRHRAN